MSRTEMKTEIMRRRYSMARSKMADGLALAAMYRRHGVKDLARTCVGSARRHRLQAAA